MHSYSIFGKSIYHSRPRSSRMHAAVQASGKPPEGKYLRCLETFCPILKGYVASPERIRKSVPMEDRSPRHERNFHDIRQQTNHI